MKRISPAAVRRARDIGEPRDSDSVRAPSSASVVICAYADDRWPLLRAGVESVRHGTLPPAEIVVVVDHNDRLLERARAELSGVRVVPNGGPRGLSAARNAGIAASTGELVAFLDDDAAAEPEWLERLLAPFAAEPVAGTGGWAAPAWEGSPPCWLPDELLWVVGCSYRGLPPDGAPLRNPIGASMAFRRRALVAVGGFREGFGQSDASEMRDDETDFAIRLRRRWPRSEIVHTPRARVLHHVPAQRASFSYLVSRCWSEGRGKALLTEHVGSSDALASERRYVLRALPGGVVRGLRDGVRGDPAGILRAMVIPVALLVTLAGYLTGRSRVPRRLQTRPPSH